MFQGDFRNPKPKLERALAEAIFNEMTAPIELVEYRYREKFHLSNAQMAAEPLDKFFTNLKIMEFESKRAEEEQKMMERKHGKS